MDLEAFGDGPRVVPPIDPVIIRATKDLGTNTGKSKDCRTSSTPSHGNGGPSARLSEAARGSLIVGPTASTLPQPHFGDGTPIIVEELPRMGVCEWAKGDGVGWRLFRREVLWL